MSIMILNRNLHVHVHQQINVLHEMYYTINTQEYTGNILQWIHPCHLPQADVSNSEYSLVFIWIYNTIQYMYNILDWW